MLVTGIFSFPNNVSKRAFTHGHSKLLFWSKRVKLYKSKIILRTIRGHADCLCECIESRIVKHLVLARLSVFLSWIFAWLLTTGSKLYFYGVNLHAMHRSFHPCICLELLIQLSPEVFFFWRIMWILPKSITIAYPYAPHTFYPDQ